MLEDLKSFRNEIAPFRMLWSKARITAAIAKRNEKWVSISTRIALSHRRAEKPVVFRPTKDFIAFSSDIELSTLDSVVEQILEKGVFRTKVGTKHFTVCFKVPDPAKPQTSQEVHCGIPYSTRHHQHDQAFRIGDSRISLTNTSVDYLYAIFTNEQRINVSSRLRTYRPRFSDIADLFSRLGLPADLNGNYTRIEIIAALPFAMNTTRDKVFVTAPDTVLPKLRLTGFFDTGDATVRLKSSTAELGEHGLTTVSGIIPWPSQSTRGKLFLHLGKEEVGCIEIKRWTGTSNWQFSVHEFFDPQHAGLRAGLEMRKDAAQFETAVVRLLTELRVPATWYGAKQYQDRPDLVACIEGKKNWWVLMGECTGQKPSEKFTRLLTRQKELQQLLGGEVQILPVVFTPSTVSTVDRQQGSQDGIAIVGSEELTQLAQSVSLGWNAEKVFEYFNNLCYCPLGLTSVFQSDLG